MALLARIATLVVAFYFVLAPQVAASGTDEYRVKLAFLFNFAKFVEWPEADDELCVGVLGEDPFGPSLERTLLGKNVRGARLSIARSNSAADLVDCDIVFVTDPSASPEAILAAFGDRPILTVGDDLEFAEAGGVAGFFVERGKVRFAISPEAAQKAGLSVSSQLLGLAKIVGEMP